MDDWSQKIPRGEGNRKRAKRGNPWWLLQTVGLGVLALVLYWAFQLFSHPIMIETFAPIGIMFGVIVCCILAAGLALRFVWWLITLPFRLFKR